MSGVEVRGALDEEAAAAVRRLVERAEAADGVGALNDDARLGLSRDEAGVVHLLAGAHGYAQLDRHGERSSVVLVVDPEQRRRGHGRALIGAARQAAAPTEPGFWAFGDQPAARGLATATGLQPVRTLLQLGRSLADLPEPTAPSGAVTIRAFRPGEDDEAWLALNAAAFAHHPEQGSMTLADLRARQHQAWFDPTGFLVATAEHGGRPDAMVGFHWTKRHPDGSGEVYVLGVDPDAAGHGLGTDLLLAGLHRLHDAGSTEVRLYVEASEAGPVHLYRRHGFTEIARDVMYAARPQRAPQQEGDGPR